MTVSIDYASIARAEAQKKPVRLAGDVKVPERKDTDTVRNRPIAGIISPPKKPGTRKPGVWAGGIGTPPNLPKPKPGIWAGGIGTPPNLPKPKPGIITAGVISPPRRPVEPKEPGTLAGDIRVPKTLDKTA